MKKYFKIIKTIFSTLALSAIFASCGKNVAEAETIQKTAGEQKEFYVLSVSPDGELPAAVKNPSIQIMFSEPVIALEKLGKPASSSDIVSIIPAIKGQFKWIGTSLLSFECDEAIIPQKEYIIQVNPKAQSKKGNPISGQIAFGFYTEELKFMNITAGITGIEKNVLFPNDEIPTEYAQDISLRFSTPVNEKYITKFIEIFKEGDPVPLAFDVVSNIKNNLRLKIKNPLEDNKQINVILKEGASSDEGCRPTSKPQKWSFNTLKEMKVDWTDLDGASWGKFSNPVRLIYTHQIKDDPEAVAKLIHTFPDMTVTKDNIQISGRSLMIYNLPVTFNSEYKLAVDPGLEDVYGRKTLNQASYDITVPSATSYVNYKDYGFHMLESQFEPKLVFEHQNARPGSSYSVKNLRGITNPEPNKNSISKTFNESDILKDTRMIEEVNLKDCLEKTKDGEYRGVIRFDADMHYTSRYRNWAIDEMVEEINTAKNSQYIQVTNLGITVRYSYNKAVVLVTKLSDGTPVENAVVSPVFKKITWDSYDVFSITPEEKYSEKTNKDGIAIIDFNKNGEDFFKTMLNQNYALYVEAKTDTDYAVFDPRSNYVYNSQWNRGWTSNIHSHKQATFIFTDRGLYKPGEKITFRGIDRTLFEEKYSEYTGSYTIKLTDTKWNPTVYQTSSGVTSESGTFTGTFTLPENMEPGSYNITYYREGANSYSGVSIPVQIQFFERLRFEVKSSIPAITYFSGDSISAEIKGNYLGGGTLSNGRYNGNWMREPVGFSAKSEKYKDLKFGPTVGYDARNWLGDKNGSLNNEGKASCDFTTGGETLKGMAYLYTLNANVSDAGNQTIGTRASTVVHPAKFYLGVSDIKNVKGFPKKGEKLNFDYFCVTPDEKVPSAKDFNSSAKIKVELIREEWKQVQQLGWNGEINTRYQREDVTDSETTIPLKISENATEFSVTPSAGGSYVLRVTTEDKFSNEIITEKRFYVTSSDWLWNNREDSSEITLTTDKNEYNVGETAQLLVNSPLPKGKYLMTIERESVISEKIINLETSSTVIEVPVEELYLPNIYVTLSSYSVRKGKPAHDFSTPDLDKPKGYFGYAVIHVSTKLKEFDVTIKAEKESYRPAEDATIKIKAMSNGKPLKNAEITLMAVDRGVIDLINYHVPNPVKFFYDEDRFLNYCLGGDSRELLIDPVTYEVRNLFGGDSAEEAETKDQVRKNFEPTAYFNPVIITDENGEAEVTFKLPDTLTAYRITAVGVNHDSFALSESELNVTNPISVREVLPRQLRLNDLSESGVVVTNMTNSDQVVKVELVLHEGLAKTGYKPSESETKKLPGLAKTYGDNVATVTVPAGQTLPVMFMITAEKQGWIAAEFIIKSDILNERLIKGLEIERQYMFETVSSTGEVSSTEDSDSNSAEEFVKIPSDIPDNVGTLTVQLDPTKLGPLQNSVDYVFRYPYGCLEQRTAKVLPLIAFGKYLKVFNLNSEVENPLAVSKSEISSWKKSQLSSGAFPYWPGSTYDSFFVSLRIAEIISIGDEKGYNLSSLINATKLAKYLSSEVNKRINDTKNNYYWDSAYALYVLSRMGYPVATSQIDAIANKTDVEFADLCYLGLAYAYRSEINKANKILTKLKKYISETTRGVDITDITENYHYWCFTEDKTEKLSTALMLFSKLDSENRLVPKIVHSLLSAQNGNGRYKSTSVTTRAFVAIDSYIKNKDLENLKFTAEVLLDGKTFAKGSFEGVDAKAVEVKEDFNSPAMKDLSRDKDIPLNFKKDGKGTLNYLMTMKYALLPKDQIARDEGICIYTEIIDTTTGETVNVNKLKTDRIYKEVIHISTTKDREYIAVRAPIPCGAEILNAAFASTGEIRDKSKEIDEEKINEKLKEFFGGEFKMFDADSIDLEQLNELLDGMSTPTQKYSPLTNQAIYDSEVQYFWDWFAKGKQCVEFYFRPTRKGTFNTPCAQATCMYEEEIFGRSSGNVWTIE